LETARQNIAIAAKALAQAEAAAESQAKVEAGAEARVQGFEAKLEAARREACVALEAQARDEAEAQASPEERPTPRQWEPSECIAFAAAMAKEVAQRLCPHPGRATGVVGRFTADLQWLAAGAGPHAEGWPDSLLPRGDAGESWWPVSWCPGAGVEAHLSAVSSRQEEAAPALAATMQGVPLAATGTWKLDRARGGSSRCDGGGPPLAVSARASFGPERASGGRSCQAVSGRKAD
jgi:hypothetical protein